MENENREIKESEKMTGKTRAGEKNAGEESVCLEEKDVREKDDLRENATEIGGGKTFEKAENPGEATDWQSGLKTTEEFLAELRQAEKDAKEKARAERKAAKGAKKARKAENKKKPFADVIIDNSGDIERLYEMTDRLYRQALEKDDSNQRQTGGAEKKPSQKEKA